VQDVELRPEKGARSAFVTREKEKKGGKRRQESRRYFSGRGKKNYKEKKKKRGRVRLKKGHIALLAVVHPGKKGGEKGAPSLPKKKKGGGKSSNLEGSKKKERVSA